MTKKIIFIVNITWQQLVEKGVSDMVLERDENGYFDHVYSVHFPAPNNQIISLNSRHTVIEIKGLSRNKFFNSTGLPYLFMPFAIMCAVWRLARLVKKEKIDIIRCIDPFHTALVGFFLSRVTRLPWCISIHADHDQVFKLNGRRGISLFILRSLRRFTLKRADLVMPINILYAEKISKYVKDKKRIRVIYHGIDTSLFERQVDQAAIRKDVGADGKKLICSAGRLRKERYVYDFIDICKAMLKRRNDFVFLLIGSGIEEEGLRREILRNGLNAFFILRSFQPRDEVINYRRCADVNICMKDGFGLLEAAASGKPVITYDIDWHRELVEDIETGILTPASDYEKAAANICRLLDNPEFAKKIAAKARENVFQNFSLQRSSEVKIQCYEYLLKIKQPN